MKKFLFLIIISPIILFGQNKTVSFIGLNLGYAAPLGSFANKDLRSTGSGLAQGGASVSLVNFGILFNQKIGFAVRWFGNAHSIEGYNGDETWGNGSIMIGPCYSVGVFRNAYVDFKAMVGSVSGILDLKTTKFEGSGLGFGLGSQFRYNFAKKWAFTYNLDYINAGNVTMKNTTFSGNTFKQSFASISNNVGIIYYFKAPEYKEAEKVAKVVETK